MIGELHGQWIRSHGKCGQLHAWTTHRLPDFLVTYQHPPQFTVWWYPNSIVLHYSRFLYLSLSPMFPVELLMFIGSNNLFNIHMEGSMSWRYPVNHPKSDRDLVLKPMVIPHEKKQPHHLWCMQVSMCNPYCIGDWQWEELASWRQRGSRCHCWARPFCITLVAAATRSWSLETSGLARNHARDPPFSSFVKGHFMIFPGTLPYFAHNNSSQWRWGLKQCGLGSSSKRSGRPTTTLCCSHYAG